MNEIFWFIIAYAIWNIATFTLYGMDKRRAKKRKWRVSEATLIACAFLMGGFGALFGMTIFRHKTSRMKFKLLIPLAILINVGIVVLLCAN